MKVMVDAAILRNGDRGSYVANCRDEKGLFLEASAVWYGDKSNQRYWKQWTLTRDLLYHPDLYLWRMIVQLPYLI